MIFVGGGGVGVPLDCHERCLVWPFLGVVVDVSMVGFNTPLEHTPSNLSQQAIKGFLL